MIGQRAARKVHSCPGVPPAVTVADGPFEAEKRDTRLTANECRQGLASCQIKGLTSGDGIPGPGVEKRGAAHHRPVIMRSAPSPSSRRYW